MYALVGYAIVNDELEAPANDRKKRNFTPGRLYKAPRGPEPTPNTKEVHRNPGPDESRRSPQQIDDDDIISKHRKARRQSANPPTYFLHQRNSPLEF